MRKYIVGLVAGLLVAALPFTAAATGFSTPEGFVQDRQRLVMVKEPDGEVGIDRADSDYVQYYEDNQEKELSDIVWAAGRDGHGQAMVLNGKGNYLSLGYNQLRLTNFSVSMWVNWQGGDNGAQLLLISQDEDNYIAVSPHYRDGDHPDGEGRIVNGLYLDVTVNGERETAFRASAPDVSTALPQNEWHHIALVAKQPSISLYVDGVLWAETLWNIGLRELNPKHLRIGDRLDMGTTLKGMVDDVEIYSTALDATQLKKLAAGVDPLDENAEIPTTTTTAATQTTTATTTTAADDGEMLNQNGGKDQSLRLALTVAGVGAGLFILLTAGSLMFGKKPTE